MLFGEKDRSEYLVDIAWKLYCEETAGDMDVKDFWEELPYAVQLFYLDKAEQTLS